MEAEQLPVVSGCSHTAVARHHDCALGMRDRWPWWMRWSLLLWQVPWSLFFGAFFLSYGWEVRSEVSPLCVLMSKLVIFKSLHSMVVSECAHSLPRCPLKFTASLFYLFFTKFPSFLTLVPLKIIHSRAKKGIQHHLIIIKGTNLPFQ